MVFDFGAVSGRWNMSKRMYRASRDEKSSQRMALVPIFGMMKG